MISNYITFKIKRLIELIVKEQQVTVSLFLVSF